MDYKKNENGSTLPTVFSYDETNKLRLINIEDHPWFAAVDVCDILGIKNARDMIIKRLDEDERSRFYLRRQGETWFVNESGLYNLIMRSNKPNAKKFRKWVTNEVLPTIRLTGSYTVNSDPEVAGLRSLNIDEKPFYNYVDLLIACGLSIRSASRSGRRRRNPQEFRYLYQTWWVNVRYANYIATMSKMRKEQKVFRILKAQFLEDQNKQLSMFEKGGQI